MLSDEEKKAYDNLIMLKYFTMEKEDKQAIVTILNLIEKQSKEIEELKREKVKRSWVHIKENGEVEPLFYVSKEKIKAKIEELDKEEKDLQNSISDEEREEYSDANISWKLMDIQIRREVLQSLLEKE